MTTKQTMAQHKRILRPDRQDQRQANGKTICQGAEHIRLGSFGFRVPFRPMAWHLQSQFGLAGDQHLA